MRFWIIQAQENPAVSRTVLGRREWRSNALATGLTERGHDVTRWRSSFSHQAKRQLVGASTTELTDEDYKLAYLRTSGYRSHVGVRRILSHRGLAREFLRLAHSQPQPDLIHVGNVPIELAIAAVEFASLKSIRVVIDIRDLWPDAYLEFVPRRLRAMRPLAAQVIQRGWPSLHRALASADAFTALSEPYLDWALAHAGRARSAADAIVPMTYPAVTNEEIAEVTLQTLRDRLRLPDGSLVATYLGNVGHQSDFDTIVRAAKASSASGADVTYVVAGSGPRYPEIEEAAQSVSSLRAPGWLEGDEIQSLMQLSAVGLICYRDVKNFRMNVPNKFVEYLAGGLSVACGVPGEMTRLVKESGCGFVYDSANANELHQSLAQLSTNSEMLERQRSAARSLHAEQFDFNTVVRYFADHLEAVADGSI